MPACSMHRATPSGARSTLTPSASRTSAEPQRDDAARLPCLATRAPHAAATIAASVEMLNVAMPSPPVPHVSRRSPGTSMGVAIARIVRANPVISSDVSPFMRSATTNPAIWGGVAAHDQLESASGLILSQRLAPDELGDRLDHRAVSTFTGLAARRMKLPMTFLPSFVRTDSGWNCTP